MTDEGGIALPSKPQGRFKRLWMEIEVEVVDEMALRSFDLHHTADADGNVTGFLDMDINERLGWALATVIAEAVVRAQDVTGVKCHSSIGPAVRHLDDAGNYAEVTLPGFPARRDDGSYPDE